MPKLLNCQPIPSEPPTNLSAPLYCTSAAATAGFRRDAGTFFDSLQRLEFPGSVFFWAVLSFRVRDLLGMILWGFGFKVLFYRFGFGIRVTPATPLPRIPEGDHKSNRYKGYYQGPINPKPLNPKPLNPDP